MSQTTACLRCGEAVLTGASACPSCGRPDPTAASPDHRRLGAIVLLAVVLLAVVLVTVKLARSTSPQDGIQCRGDATAAGVDAEKSCAGQP